MQISHHRAWSQKPWDSALFSSDCPSLHVPPLRFEQNLKPQQVPCGFCKKATSLQTAGDAVGFERG